MEYTLVLFVDNIHRKRKRKRKKFLEQAKLEMVNANDVKYVRFR